MLWLPVKKYRDRLDELQNTSKLSAGVKKNIADVRAIARAKVKLMFPFVFVAVIVIVVFGFDSYARSVEPRADVLGYLPFIGMAYGVAMLGVAIVLWNVVSVAWQVYSVKRVMGNKDKAFTVSIGKLGVTVTAWVAVIGCALYGMVARVVFLWDCTECDHVCT